MKNNIQDVEAYISSLPVLQREIALKMRELIKKQNERDRLNYPYQKIESIFYYIDTGNTHLLLYNNLDVRYSKIPRGNYQLNIGWEDSNSTNFKDSINIELTQNLTYELDY